MKEKPEKPHFFVGRGTRGCYNIIHVHVHTHTHTRKCAHTHTHLYKLHVFRTPRLPLAAARDCKKVCAKTRATYKLSLAIAALLAGIRVGVSTAWLKEIRVKYLWENRVLLWGSEWIVLAQ